MGLFSWKTCDTQEPIQCVYSSRGPTPVWFLWPDGRKELEEAYDGYGRFCGTDFHTELAKATLGEEACKGVDDETIRHWGIELYYADDRGSGGSKMSDLAHGDDALAQWAKTHTKKDVLMPKFAMTKDAEWADLPNPKPDPEQGCG